MGPDFDKKLEDLKNGEMKDKLDKIYIRVMIDDEDDSVTTEKFLKMSDSSIEVNQ